MKLNLSGVRDLSRENQPFSYEIVLPDYELGGTRPVTSPVAVRGEVKNTAGLLTVEGVMETELSLICDRCAGPFTREKSVKVSCALSQSSESDGENDDIFVYQGDEVELDDIFIPAFVLDMDMKVLCREDCKGLCPRCGKNLNEGDCGCKPEADPRWDALKNWRQS